METASPEKPQKFSIQMASGMKFPPYESSDPIFMKQFMDRTTIVTDHQGIEVYGGIRYDSMARKAISEAQMDKLNSEKLERQL